MNHEELKSKILSNEMFKDDKDYFLKVVDTCIKLNLSIQDTCLVLFSEAIIYIPKYIDLNVAEVNTIK